MIPLVPEGLPLRVDRGVRIAATVYPLIKDEIVKV
jgi:hypothetical protein